MNDQSNRFGWQLVAPTAALTLLLLVLPLFFSLYVSFHRWDLAVVPSRLIPVGLANYAALLADPEIWRSAGFTISYTVASVAGEFVVGFGLALLIHRARFGQGVFIALLILPMMMAPIVTGLAWRLMLNSEYGPLNQILGIQGTLWLGDVTLARISVVAATVWQEAPFMLVLLLAGLRSLPAQPIEAAMIDGANAWQRLVYIILPMMRPVIVVTLLIRTIFEFRAFDIIWILTGGGPAGSTESLAIKNFHMSFRHFAIGPGAALSWIMLIATTLMALWYIYALGKAHRRAAS